MKIFITGATGMVGRNILENESAQQFEILAPARKELDLSDKIAVENFLNYTKPDFVIHAAGKVGGIAANVADPYGFLYENLIINQNLIGACKKIGVSKLVNLSSSCVFPRNRQTPLKESDILTGELEPTNEGYAIAKIAAMKLCQFAYQTDPQKFQYKTLIPCNLFGRHDHFNPQVSHMLPSIIRKIDDAKKGKTGAPTIWGDGKARREFMYVGDLADFIWYAVNHFEKIPNTLNVGLGYDHSVQEYHQVAARIMGYDGPFYYDLTKPVGMSRKLVDTTLLQNLGWKPKTSLEEGIRKTYEFFLEGESK